MKAGLAALFLLAAIVTATIALAPASLVDRRIAALSAGALRVADARGSLWQGQGLLTDATGSWRVPLTWVLDPHALLRGAISVQFSPGSGAATPTGALRMHAKGGDLENLSISLPATALSSAWHGRSAPTLGGELSLHSPALQWEGTRATGTVEFTWQRARALLPLGNVDLGQVTAQLTAEDGTLTGPLKAQGGDLTIDGSIKVDPVHLEVGAVLTPQRNASAALRQTLALLGTANAEGGIRVAWRGAWRSDGPR